MTSADQLQLSDEELIAHDDFSEDEFNRLEAKLTLYAAVRHWTGDPLKQPLPVVAGFVREIIRERSSAGGEERPS